MKMKIDEVKLRINEFIQGTIDLYIPPNNIFDKMKNATAKLWIDQNIWKLYKAIDTFGDQYGEIDIDKIMCYYEDSLFENNELRLDIKTMIPKQYEWLNEYLPNKIILFKKEDLKHLFS
jgi:hypothetical protein